jgi:hypothetical protein
MVEQPIDVEKVVREVLARLGAAPAKRDVAPPPSAEPETPPGVVSGESDGALSVGTPVVTMAELEGKLDGVKRLVVPARSVVTPSVRDELHRRGIALVCGSGAPATSAGAVRLVMTVLGSRFDPGPLARTIQGEGIEVDQRRAECLIAATDELAGEVGRPNTLGLILSADPAVAVCLANRHRGVRAIRAVDPTTVDADAASVGANLLVVNPASASVFQLSQMVRGFCRGGPRACPETLRERLG